jgi:hypothetical protein
MEGYFSRSEHTRIVLCVCLEWIFRDDILMVFFVYHSVIDSHVVQWLVHLLIRSMSFSFFNRLAVLLAKVRFILQKSYIMSSSRPFSSPDVIEISSDSESPPTSKPRTRSVPELIEISSDSSESERSLKRQRGKYKKRDPVEVRRLEAERSARRILRAEKKKAKQAAKEAREEKKAAAKRKNEE